MMCFNKRFKEFRNKIRYSQTELAKKIGVSSAFISLIENGNSNPSIESLSKIAKAFDLNISWLLTGEGEMLITNIKTKPTSQSMKKLLNINEMLLEENSRLSKTINDLLQKYVLNVEE